MKAWAPQGIEIAPASDFGEFKRLNPSPASIFPNGFVISKISGPWTRPMVTYNFLDSQRPAVILSENEIQTPADKTIAKVFRIHDLWSRKPRSKFENARIVRPPFVEQLPP